MDYNKTLEYIHSFTRFGSQLSLDRMKKLLKKLNNPQNKLKFIHIAGTNGKGSTAQMCTEILINANYKVGTYTSPFVFDFRERFRVNNNMISKDEFVNIVNYINPYVNELENDGLNVTEFEMITAIGFEFFYRQNCDIVCLEVGLGGKFDATNVIDTPLASIITSISLDHTQILGDTIEKIAEEKAGIIKNNSDVISYPLQDVDAISVFMKKCFNTNSSFILPNAKNVEILSNNISGSKFKYQNDEYSIKLVGEHQIFNAIAVIEAMSVINKKGFNINIDNIKNGLNSALMPARFQIINEKPLIILDGAHNEQSIHALTINLDKLNDKYKIAIVGMMKDKNYKQAIKEIALKCNAIITVPVDCPRAIDNKYLAEIATQYCNNVYSIDDYNEAINKAYEIYKNNLPLESSIIVCGSFYLASDFKKIFK